jgi:hypothetical protein
MTTAIIIIVVFVVVAAVAARWSKRSAAPSLPAATPLPQRKTFEILATRNTSQGMLSRPGPSPITTGETTRRFAPASGAIVPRHCPECQTVGQVSQVSPGSWRCDCCDHQW